MLDKYNALLNFSHQIQEQDAKYFGFTFIPEMTLFY